MRQTPVVVLLACFASTAAFAHGGHGGSHADAVARSAAGTPFGRPGDAQKISRSVAVNMSDSACQTPGELALRVGETVRLLIRNSGRETHELVIGTMSGVKEHAETLEQDADVDHDEPYMAHVEPQTGQAIVWQFTRVGIFYYGCHVPSLPGPGVVGRVTVSR